MNNFVKGGGAVIIWRLQESVKKILVVDDEPTLVATLQFNLEREGYRVATAADGGSALSVARREHPDVILLDLKLPGMDGLEPHRARSHFVKGRTIFTHCQPITRSLGDQSSGGRAII